MTIEQFNKLSLIIRQLRDVVKRSIDEVCQLGESALTVFIKNEETNQKLLSSPVNDEKGLIDKSKLAKRLDVSERTISNLLDDGLPFISVRSSIKFDYEEVLIWLKDQESKENGKNKLRVVR